MSWCKLITYNLCGLEDEKGTHYHFGKKTEARRHWMSHQRPGLQLKRPCLLGCLLSIPSLCCWWLWSVIWVCKDDNFTGKKYISWLCDYTHAVILCLQWQVRFWMSLLEGAELQKEEDNVISNVCLMDFVLVVIFWLCNISSDFLFLQNVFISFTLAF